MGDHHGSYPLSSGKQGTLFQRNPVCALAYDVCTQMCEEFGGVNFNLINCLEVADDVCAYMVTNAWDPLGVDQYYHWIKDKLYNESAVMVACATVCISVSVMEDAPEPLRTVGKKMRGLVYGEANGFFENIQSAVNSEDISLSVASYGQPPPEPPIVQENMELKAQNNQLVRQVIAAQKELKRMETKQYNQFLGPVFQFKGCTFKDSHDTTTIGTQNNYCAPPSSQVDPDECSSSEDDSPEPEQPSAQRGPRLQYLFSDEYGRENVKRSQEEAERVADYIADHHMGQMRLDSKRTNKLNLMVACFWYRWDEQKWVNSIPQGAAIYRFFTDYCKLPCDVQPRAFMNVICALINEGKKDPEIYDNLCEYFPQ